MKIPRPHNRLWPDSARAMAQCLYEANTSLDTILDELQAVFPSATWEMLTNEIKRQGYRRSAPQCVSPMLRDEALFLKAFGRVRSDVDRLNIVPPCSFPAKRFSMIGDRL